jgi:ABC-type transport system involved in multi-copper enzyme maturation permease subunit
MQGFANVAVIAWRELREGARRSRNYWLRSVGGACAAAILLVVGKDATVFSDVTATVGLRIFLDLHLLLLLLIFVLVPFLTGDTIAREKREGTLGLLLMTPLSAMGITIGKALTQAFRAFTVWLAALPILALPFLLGGVTWGDFASALMMELCFGILCLAAGMLASSIVRGRTAAFSTAFVLAAGFITIPGWFLSLATGGPTLFPGGASRLITGTPFFAGAGGTVVVQYVRVSGPIPAPSVNPFILSYGNGPAFFAPPSFFGMPQIAQSTGWSGFFSAGSRVFWLSLLAGCFLLSLLTLWLSLRFAARAVAATWKDDIPTERRLRLVERYCTPLWKNWMAKRMERALDSNPIVWLQQYSWKARTTKWTLALLVIFVDGLAMDTNLVFFEIIQQALVMVLAIVLTVAGGGGFLAEKRSGALELILVTPLGAEQIIFGRILGLLKLVLPSAIIIAASSFARFSLENYYGPSGLFVMEIPFVMIAAMNLALFSTYFGLRCKTLAEAAVSTWIVVFAPAALTYFWVAMSPDVVATRQDEIIAAVAALPLIPSLGLTWWGCRQLAGRLSQLGSAERSPS